VCGPIADGKVKRIGPENPKQRERRLLMIAAEWGQEEDCEGKGRQNNKKNVD
jgi:hypothetical protein